MITLDVNGQQITTDAAEDTPLLWVLRDNLKLTGTKFGCGMAQCGACTVHIDGTATRSCVLPVSAVDIAPTLATMLGVPVPAQCEGRSLVEALVRPESKDGR